MGILEGGGRSIGSGVSSRSMSPPRGPRAAPLHLLGHAAEEVVLRLRGVRVLRLGFTPRLLHGGLLPPRVGAWRGRGDAEPRHPPWAWPPRSPSPCQHVMGWRAVPSPRGDPLPTAGGWRAEGPQQLLGAGPESGLTPSAWVWGVGS